MDMQNPALLADSMHEKIPLPTKTVHSFDMQLPLTPIQTVSHQRVQVWELSFEIFYLSILPEHIDHSAEHTKPLLVHKYP